MYKTKLNAYTLTEIIVVLIVSTIVVGIGFGALRLVHKQITTYKNYQNTKLQLTATETKLNILFHQAEHIEMEQDELLFITNKDSISVELFSNYVLIDKDSIPLKVESIKVYLEGNNVQSGQLDALELHVEIAKNLNTSLFVCKSLDTKLKSKSWESR